tara:strand:+ start:267 stop:896 length:630 start_codon:yes stop_codon:yes gene_type:complete
MNKSEENNNQNQINEEIPRIEKEEDKNDIKIENNNSPEKSQISEIKELKEKVIRLLADMENQRRRFEKEKDEAYDYGGFSFARELLAVIDNLDRAKISISNNETFKKNKELNQFLENLEIITNDVTSIFKKNGVHEINCLNQKFDPNFHQAMMEIEDEHKEPGTVLQEIQKGFKMKERLLRPSLVGISKKKIVEENDNKEKINENGKTL